MRCKERKRPWASSSQLYKARKEREWETGVEREEGRKGKRAREKQKEGVRLERLGSHMGMRTSMLGSESRAGQRLLRTSIFVHSSHPLSSSDSLADTQLLNQTPRVQA